MKREKNEFRIGTAIMMCSLSVWTMSARSAESVTLVKDGQPRAVIVLGGEPTKAAQFGARELQDQLKAITGATVPIKTEAAADETAVYVGESDPVRKAGLGNNQFKEQEYVVKFLPNGIILTGLDAPDRSKVGYDPEKPDSWTNLPGFWEEKGSLNAVYDFLERFCAVRYFNPTEFGTSLPRQSTLTVSAEDVRRSPFFRYREVHPVSAQPEKMDVVNVMWKAGAPEFEEWRGLAYPSLSRQFTDTNQFAKAYRNIAFRYLLRSGHGGEKMAANHSLYPYYDYFWSKDSKAFIEPRPEWFAQGWGEGKPEQMCYTNESLAEQVAHEADFYFQGKSIKGDAARAPNWGRTNFAVVPQDNEFHCRCEKCQKLLKGKKNEGMFNHRDFSTDLMFTFVNSVAEKVKKTHPEQTVSALAYAGYMAPPSFPLADNVAVQFCWDSNRAPEFCDGYKECEKYLHEWAKKNPPKGLYLWLYYTFPHEFAENGNYHCFPGFFAHTVGKQFTLFHKLGIKGMFHCGYGQEVESYVTFRLMDDPTLQIDQLLDEYFLRMYGPAAKPMKEIYAAIEQIYEDQNNRPQGVGGAELSWGHQGTPERMKKLQALLDDAKNLATSSPEKERVALWDKGVWRYMTKGAGMYNEKMSAPMPKVVVPQVAGADGDPNKVDWSKATSLGEWYNFGQGTPATRKLSAKLACDGKFLYLELNDPCDTSKVETAAAVFPADDWEIFVSAQRGKPYRQYAAGPSGKLVALSHGEMNFRDNVAIENPGVIVASEKLPELWRVRVALPLDKMLAKAVLPGDRLFLNVIRIASQALSKAPGRFDMSSLVSHSTVHDPIRAAELTLEK